MKRWLSYLHLLLSVSAMAHVPVHPAAGQNTLTVYAAHPSGQFATNKASTFTVAANAADVVDTKFDGGGYITNRVWKNSQGQTLRTQNLTWDAFGRLVKQTERDSGNNGYNWQTDFDPLGRRLRTVTTPVTNNVAITAQQRVLSHYYDPQVEFLEIGLSVNGTTTWKTYGPDLDGVYGGQQGLGGLESLTTGSATVGVIQDGFGNVLGSALNGSVTWNTSRLGLYGPAEGYPGRSISVAPLTAEHLAYRGKWRDEAGFYYWGARPYEAERRSFLSFDTLGHDATPDGYTAFAGRPTDIWDADGRLGRSANAQLASFEDSFINGTVGLIQMSHYGLGNWLDMPHLVSQGDMLEGFKSPMQRIGTYTHGSFDAQIGESAAVVAGAYGLARQIPSIANRVGNWLDSSWPKPGPSAPRMEYANWGGEFINDFPTTQPRMTTVIGSLEDTAPFKGRPGFNVLDVPDAVYRGMTPAEFDRLNASWMNTALQSGDAIWAVTDPAVHAQFLERIQPGLSGQSRYLNLELPMLEEFGATIPMKPVYPPVVPFIIKR